MLQSGATSQDLVNAAQSFGYTSCEMYVLLIHTKGQHDWSLLSLLGMFTHEPPRRLRPSGGSASIDLAANRSIKLFDGALNLADTAALLNSANRGPLVFPGLPAGQNQVAHNLDTTSPKPITYLPASAVMKSSLRFLPRDRGGITLFELVDLKQQALAELDPNVNPGAIPAVDNILASHIAFSIADNRARLGNVIVAAAIDDFSIRMRGDKSGAGLRVKCIPNRVVSSDYIVSVTSEIEGEVTSGFCAPLTKNGFHIPDIDVSGNLTVDVWSLANQRLVARDHGNLFRKIGISMSVASFQRRAFLRDESGATLQEKDVTVASLVSTPASGPQDWQDRVRAELVTIKKKETLLRKQLIPCGRGDGHQKALEKIIDLLKSYDGPVKIWDPYAGKFDLDFLTFMTRTVPVQVISDLTEPPSGTKDAKSCPEKLLAAAKSCVLENKKIPERVKKPIRERDAEVGRARHQARIDGMKAYLDELRSVKVDVRLRYRGGGRGFPFHDRFLIVGARCWSLGISLNHIGESHSLIIEVPYPEVVEKEFDDLWKQLDGCEL